MTDDIPFLGTGWGFPPTFLRAGATVRMASGATDIRESLAILLSTSLGERIMQPTYGCNLRDDLFESINESFRAYLEDKVRMAILYHEPRIRLDGLRVVPEPLEGRVVIELDYTIRTTNARHNMVFPFYLDETAEGAP